MDQQLTELEAAINSESDDTLEEMLDYLDDLRESGATNMFGAGTYVAETFCLSKALAKKVLVYWMETFSKRQETKEVI